MKESSFIYVYCTDNVRYRIGYAFAPLSCLDYTFIGGEIAQDWVLSDDIS